MGRLRIVIGDDHTLMRQGLRKILEEQREWEVVAEAGDGRQAVKETLSLQPDVALLDIGMPRCTASKRRGKSRRLSVSGC